MIHISTHTPHSHVAYTLLTCWPRAHAQAPWWEHTRKTGRLLVTKFWSIVSFSVSQSSARHAQEVDSKYIYYIHSIALCLRVHVSMWMLERIEKKVSIRRVVSVAHPPAAATAPCTAPALSLFLTWVWRIPTFSSTHLTIKCASCNQVAAVHKCSVCPERRHLRAGGRLEKTDRAKGRGKKRGRRGEKESLSRRWTFAWARTPGFSDLWCRVIYICIYMYMYISIGRGCVCINKSCHTARYNPSI